MRKPLLRAEGIIFSDDGESVFVQCDKDESFYRFPGGAIEFGETAAEAIVRELVEEFDLEVAVRELIATNESIVEYDGKQRHDCTLIHRCELVGNRFGESAGHGDQALQHKEREEIQLVWKKVTELSAKPVYPEGIMEVLGSGDFQWVRHLVVRKSYD
jgi:ADP-ribose pyrophosphatase YjhB (NUDIX family)